jgi:aminobenzoyl-glutamate utilization protein B
MQAANFFRIFLLLVGAALTSGGALPAQDLAADRQDLIDHIESHRSAYTALADQIWDWAELGYQEKQSSAALQELLRTADFQIEAGVAGIPTAFVASYGSGSPVIAILGEFDALPGVSQAAAPFVQERTESPNGHACGHHLFGVGSAAAALAVADWLRKTGTPGTVRFYGTPAEEGGAGKVYLVRAGLFKDVDAVLHWHPGAANQADARSSLANKSAKFRFRGKASHAAISPWNGRSALDGVEAMNYMVNLMREHVTPETRIHYVITRGGEAPNVVPAQAEVFYYVRHPEMAEVKALFERLVRAAEGAARGTGTEMEYEVIHGLYNLLPNRTLGAVVHRQLATLGGFNYTPEERAFAQRLQESLPQPAPALTTTAQVKPFEVNERGSGASTDVGDVSWVVPTAGFSTATWVPGTSAHSWQAVAAGGTSIGHRGMILAAQTLALSAAALFSDPDLLREAAAELRQRRGDGFTYESLLGDREPPLDYRN